MLHLYVTINGVASYSASTIPVCRAHTLQEVAECLASLEHACRLAPSQVLYCKGGAIKSFCMFDQGVTPSWEDAALRGCGAVVRVESARVPAFQLFTNLVAIMTAVPDLVGARLVLEHDGTLRTEAWCRGPDVRWADVERVLDPEGGLRCRVSRT
jgi:hypothetical protein